MHSEITGETMFGCCYSLRYQQRYQTAREGWGDELKADQHGKRSSRRSYGAKRIAEHLLGPQDINASALTKIHRSRDENHQSLHSQSRHHDLELIPSQSQSCSPRQSHPSTRDRARERHAYRLLRTHASLISQTCVRSIKPLMHTRSLASRLQTLICGHCICMLRFDANTFTAATRLA